MARTAHHSSRCPDPSSEHGFTLVEVLVAIVVLLVGVLGVVSLVDGANAVTSKTRAREGGTNVARTIIEISRSIR
jgi:prepilin-type N-terminal cleavage/methylation domain-containing protein